MFPDVSFSGMKTCNFYKILLNEKKIRPKCESVFPQINFNVLYLVKILKFEVLIGVLFTKSFTLIIICLIRKLVRKIYVHYVIIV